MLDPPTSKANAQLPLCGAKQRTQSKGTSSEKQAGTSTFPLYYAALTVAQYTERNQPKQQCAIQSQAHNNRRHCEDGEASILVHIQLKNRTPVYGAKLLSEVRKLSGD